MPVRLLLRRPLGRARRRASREGLEALPGARVPYRGGDPWVARRSCSPAALLAASRRCWRSGRARRRGRARRSPRRWCSTTLYAVPVVERPPRAPYADGALFALLLAALLWADRVAAPHAAPAATLVALATLAAPLVAPRVDASRPWIDLEQLAGDAGAPPRRRLRLGPQLRRRWTGRATGARCCASRRAARPTGRPSALDDFDGRALAQDAAAAAASPTREIDAQHPDWIQHVASRSAGCAPSSSWRGHDARASELADARPSRSARGTFVTERGPLRRGDYLRRARLHPDARARRDARGGTDYPDFVAAV